MASTVGDPLESALDELYGLDPAEFVAARKRIAAQLRADGERVASKTVLAVRKPTAVAGVLNRLARDQPAVITEFLDRSTELGRSFRVSRDEVRAATAAHRDALRTLTDAALGLLGGRDNYRGQIQSTLHAAGLDDAVAQRLRSGRLEKEATGPSGFGEIELTETGATVPSAPPVRVRHLRVAPALDSSDPDTAETVSPAANRAVEELRRAESERLAREREERVDRERAEAAAEAARRAEVHRAQLRAALEAATTNAFDAASELEAARRLEHDLEEQLLGAHDRRERAEVRDHAARATAAEAHAALDLDSATTPI